MSLVLSLSLDRAQLKQIQRWQQQPFLPTAKIHSRTIRNWSVYYSSFSYFFHLAEYSFLPSLLTSLHVATLTATTTITSAAKLQSQCSRFLNHRKFYWIKSASAFRWANTFPHSLQQFKNIFVVILHFSFLSNYTTKKKKICKYWRVLLFFYSFAFLVFIKTSNYFSFLSTSVYV